LIENPGEPSDLCISEEVDCSIDVDGEFIQIHRYPLMCRPLIALVDWIHNLYNLSNIVRKVEDGVHENQADYSRPAVLTSGAERQCFSAVRKQE
jgi:hypothetical protein